MKTLIISIISTLLLSASVMVDRVLYLTMNMKQGQELILNDESHWEIAPEDLRLTENWIGPVPIRICFGGDKEYPYFLHNLVTGHKIRARTSPAPTIK